MAHEARSNNKTHLYGAVAVLEINTPRVERLVSSSDLEVVDAIDLHESAMGVPPRSVTFFTTLGSAAMRLESSSKMGSDASLA